MPLASWWRECCFAIRTVREPSFLCTPSFSALQVLVYRKTYCKGILQNWLCLKGSVAVIIPPLLCGSTAGGSLRSDWRRPEDKLRPFCLNLNTSQIHQNRELPSAYVCYLGVADSTLPNKGTAHRALRGVEAAPVQVNSQLNLQLQYGVLAMFFFRSKRKGLFAVVTFFYP